MVGRASERFGWSCFSMWFVNILGLANFALPRRNRASKFLCIFYAAAPRLNNMKQGARCCQDKASLTCGDAPCTPVSVSFLEQ